MLIYVCVYMCICIYEGPQSSSYQENNRTYVKLFQAGITYMLQMEN